MTVSLLTMQRAATATAFVGLLLGAPMAVGTAQPNPVVSRPGPLPTFQASARTASPMREAPLHLTTDEPSVAVEVRPEWPATTDRQVAVEERPTMEDLLVRIDALRELADDWDGDGAPAPTPEALGRARALLDEVGRLPNEIDADAIGGVALWFYSRDGRRLMIGLRNTGRAVVCSYLSAATIPDVSALPDAADAAGAARAILGQFA